MYYEDVVEIFAGPGGWSTGLAALGENSSVGFEWDETACETARAAGHKRVQADVSLLSPARLFPRGVRGLIASPPCPGFSIAGKGRGRQDLASVIKGAEMFAAGLDPRFWLKDETKDDRSALALEPLRWVLELEPSWTAWEQVPAVLPLWEACAEILRERGYSVWTGNVQAEQYGIPQTRKRAILIASRVGIVGRPQPTHSRFNARSPRELEPNRQPWVSMADALGWGMTERPSMTVTGGGTSTGGAEPFGNSSRQGMRREIDAGRWRWDGPGGVDPTLPATTVCGDPRLTARSHHDPGEQGRGAVTSDVVREAFESGTAYVDHGEKRKAKGSVRISVEEAAVLQSFPRDYRFHGRKGDQFRQVGDAVPPLLAAHVLRELGVGYSLPLNQDLINHYNESVVKAA